MIYLYTDFLAVVLIFIASIFRSQEGFFIIENGKFYFHLRQFAFGLFVLFSYSLLTGLSAFRYYVGTDYESYANRIVTDVITGSTNQKEILFTQIVKIAIGFGSVQWIFILSSIIFVGFLYKYIIDQSTNLSLSVFLIIGTTFYSFSLNAVRQAMATAIFLYATKFIVKHRPISYAFWILIAIGFHKMAIVYLPVYFLGNIKIKKTSAIIYVSLLSIILFLFKDVIRKVLLLILSKISILSQYTAYFGSSFDDTLKHISVAFLLLNILVTGFIILCSREDDFSDSMNISIWLQLIITVFSGVSFAIPAAFRVFYIFVPVQIVLIPNLINLIKNRNERWLFVGIFVAIYLLIFWYFIIHSNYNQTLPYGYTLNF